MKDFHDLLLLLRDNNLRNASKMLAAGPVCGDKQKWEAAVVNPTL